MQLKDYQRETLDKVTEFCRHVRQSLDGGANFPVHDAYRLVCEREYYDVPQLAGVPYFCLRVPTGGGKTLIAAHAVGAIGKHLGHQDRPLCLWVTPSTTIREQTLQGLKDRDHPYRQALRDSLGGEPLEVMTIEEALSASRSKIASAAVVVVTTIQSYRIDKEENRKVYQDNGYLMDHFRDLPIEVREQMIADSDSDRASLSLANAMKLRGPIVVMDEAHNARTRISFDSLQRFGPLAVLELTATPQLKHDPDKGEYASNVLHAVSALQLKQEGMIKLPVELESRKDWLEVLALTVQRRKELEDLAKTWRHESKRYVRPIALIQAQPKSKKNETHTVDVVKEALTERLKVPEEQIRVATGDKDDLGAEDLRDEKCEVRYVITVDKLREGWDCPFAYILGSLGNVATESAVEQLLGRVLRMPHAMPTGVMELDRAYAVVQSENVVETATKLCDSLVNYCGFDKDTVGDTLRVHRVDDPQKQFSFTTITVSTPPNVKKLSQEVRDKLHYDAKSSCIHVKKPLTREETQQLRDVLPSQDHAAVENFWLQEHEPGTIAKKLDEYAKPLSIPQLVVRDGKRSYLFEPIELDEYDWNLDKCDVTVTESEFSGNIQVGQKIELEVNQKGGVRIGSIQEVIARQLTLFAKEDYWDKKALVRWFDNELHHGGTMAGLPKSKSEAWLLRYVDYLLDKRKCDKNILVRRRHDLIRIARVKLADHGRQQLREAARMLIDGRSPRKLETSVDMSKILEEPKYCPYRRYSGSYTFKKHAFVLVGDMGKGEESACAKQIDDHPNVKRWVRNLEQESAGGVCLPLSPGRFFPDFIVELNDGRIAMVEYKGKHLSHDPDELRKKEIGELWADRSEGNCVFAWIVNKDWATLEKALASR